MATSVGIREAKTNLSKYLKLVKCGRVVVLTERGWPIGKIVPLDKNELSLDDRIRKLEDSGILEPAKKASSSLPPIKIAGKGVQATCRKTGGSKWSFTGMLLLFYPFSSKITTVQKFRNT